MRRNNRLLSLLILSILFLPAPSLATENPPNGLIFSEIQTGSSSSASQEFVELHNPTSDAIDLSNKKIQYFSATTTVFETPSRSVLMHGVLAPGEYYLIASNGYLTEQADDHFSAGLSQAGGHLRIVDLENNIFDLVGWGTASSPEGEAAPAPEAGESLQRQTDADGFLVDTNINSQDFATNSVPTPQSTQSATVEPEQEPLNQTAPEPGAESSESESSATTNPNLLPLQITELLPNPAPPATDADDEYIELYNPNPEPVDLNGYKLQAGLTYSYNFVFTDQTLPPNSYGVFYVSETGLLLANSGGRARLLSPSSQVLSETSQYEDAASGEAWVLYGGTWQWTTTPTPAEPNNLALPAIVTKTASTKTKGLKPAKKVKAAKKSAAKTKKTFATTAERGTFAPIEEQTTTPLNMGVLAAIGSLSVLYACYEYRHDLSNRLHQLRRYREARRATRQTS